jgi:RimJ/RimL family protein N-acetyltransferase
MENIKIFAGKYYLSSIIKTDNLNNYLSWMKNPLENQYILSAKDNYSIDELYTFIDTCNKDENTILLGIYDKIDDNHIGNIKYDNINKLDKSAYLGILIGEQRYRQIGVAKQAITISIKWLNENLGIENILLGVDNSNIHALKLYQKLGFRPIANKGKNGLLMNLNINELKNNDS